ncbi:MAG: hypothetical protein AB7I52_13580 [Rhizobiaceae bacterium]
MPFDLPRGRMFPVAEIDVRLLPGPHPYETANLASIDAHWRTASAANPALFDGQVVLLASLALAGDRLVGTCHSVRFATFLHWRRDGAVPAAEHAFAAAMMVTSDGALIAGRMGRQTANAGQVYLPAGTFEAADFVDGKVDADRNMAREVMEETGQRLAGLDRDPAFHAMWTQLGTVIVRRYYLPEPADLVAARIAEFIASETEPEITEAVVIRGPQDRPQGLAGYMTDVIAWHFANPPDASNQGLLPDAAGA